MFSKIFIQIEKLKLCHLHKFELFINKGDNFRTYVSSAVQYWSASIRRKTALGVLEHCCFGSACTSMKTIGKFALPSLDPSRSVSH